MSDSHVFVDTNILVYAHDLDAREKRETAKQKVEMLWQAVYPPAISIQVLQELYVNLNKKKIAIETAQELVVGYLCWEVIENSVELFKQSLDIQRRYKLSFWDSMIIAAAIKARAKEIWSEDLSHGQIFDGVEVVNPFK